MNTSIFFSFIISLPILALMDFLFLGVLMKDYYQKLMSPAVTIEFNVLFAFLFYFFYLIGIFVFVVLANMEGDISKVILYGALFGFFCYMTYDFTNVATIKNWPIQLIWIDIAWGTFVTSVISVIAYKIVNFF